MNYENNISKYETEEGKAIRAEIAEAGVAIKNIDAQIITGDSVEDGASADPDIDDLLNGNITTPQSWPERKISLLRLKQKLNNHIDALSVKYKIEQTKSGMKLAAEIKPQVDKLEKEIVDAAIVLHKLHLKHFQAKRSFLNNSIGTYGNFSSTIDDVLGVPVSSHTKLAQFFLEAGQLPKEMRG
jgi:hypothetical protein